MGKAEQLLQELCELMATGYVIDLHDLRLMLRLYESSPHPDIRHIFSDRIPVPSRRRYVSPKTEGQKFYVDAIRHHDIVFAIGPAGTGKTYLAMAMAVSSLFHKEIERIILVRPAVEAGEKLGFLPGDLQEKVNPYLRPLYDALYDTMEFERAQKLMERGTIEIAPLAYMRGRTLNDSFIILDEAQNTTSEQMKMFLTRLGYNSKAVITGDVTQVDLAPARSRDWSRCKTSCAVSRVFASYILPSGMSSATNWSSRSFAPMRPFSQGLSVVVRATEGERRPMERERKGRARPERGVRPLLTKLGVVTVSKSGGMKIAWREIGITALLVATLTILLLPRLQLQTRTLRLVTSPPPTLKPIPISCSKMRYRPRKASKRLKIVCCHSTI